MKTEIVKISNKYTSKFKDQQKKKLEPTRT